MGIQSIFHRVLASCRHFTCRERILVAVLVAGATAALLVPQSRWSDHCFFGGDTHEYQSLAVNQALGYGPMRFGAMNGDLASYGFLLDPRYVDPELIRDHYVNAGRFNAYRTPGYPMFLGAVYAVFGVSPRAAKQTQFALLVLAALVIPMLTTRYWGTTGYVAGLVGMVFFLSCNFKLSEQILTESLITFMVGVIAAVMLLVERRPNWATAGLLGATLTAACLVKGSFLFVPPLAGLWLLWLNRRSWRRAMLLAAVYSAAGIAAVLPWSLYASNQVGHFVLLSTQGPAVLYTFNNEKTHKGYWRPDYTWYENDGMADRSPALRVLNFYVKNPKSLANFFFKLKHGIGPMGFLSLAALAAIALWLLMHGRSGPTGLRRALAILAILGVVAYGYMAVVSVTDGRFDYWGVAVWLPALVVTLPRVWRHRERAAWIPFILCLNFVLLTLMAGAAGPEIYRNRFLRPLSPITCALGAVMALRCLRLATRLLRRRSSAASDSPAGAA